MEDNNNIWNQIESSFNEEVSVIRLSETEKFQNIISNILKSGMLLVKDYFVSVYGDDYAKNEFYFDIIKYQMLTVENDILVKSLTCDSIISKIINFYIEMLKWKLEASVYNYLAGIELKQVEKIHFSKSVQGFNGEWHFITTTGEIGRYSTKTIIASGPIMRPHYRYISHIYGKVNLDSTKRVQLLNRLKLKKPKLIIQTRAEKELLTRINSCKSKIIWIERDISNSQTQLMSYYHQLQDVNTPISSVNYLKNRIIDHEIHSKTNTLRLNDEKTTLEGLLKLNITDIENEFELKKDKKRIKELKDFLNSNTLKRLSTIKDILYQTKLGETLSELNSLYEKYPAIKKRDTNSKINDLKKNIEYKKQSLIYIENNKSESSVKISDLKNEISELETQLKNLK